MSSSSLSPSKICSDNGVHTHDSSSELPQALQNPEAAGAETSAAAHEGGASSSESNFTPPGSPGGLHKEPSVHQLYQSARVSFGGRLQPQDGNLVALEHPVRQGPSIMVTAQDWTATDATTAAAPTGRRAAAKATPHPSVVKITEEDEEEEEEEPWRPPSPQPSPPRARLKIQTLLDRSKAEEKRRQDECAGTASEMTVVASAPGKVILFGEHAVVYGKTAVGAAVSDLRIVAEATCTEQASLVIHLPDIGVTFTRKSQEVAAAFDVSAIAAGGQAVPPGPALLDSISAFVGDDDAWPEEGKKGVVPLVFLVLALVPQIFVGKGGPGARGLSLAVFSASLPVGAGLGSSAALCVATVAALTRLAEDISRGGGGGGGSAGKSAGDVDGAAAAAGGAQGGKNGSSGSGGQRPSQAELERINAWAFAGETVLHGTPSGLDNTVSCYGGAIKFIKGMDGARNTTDPIPGFPPLPILLTNTLVPKDTRALVAGVRRLLDAHGAPTTATFDAIGAIAAEFLERAAASVSMPAAANGAAVGVPAAEGGGSGDGGKETEVAGSPLLSAECVGELAEMNHRLLCALGVGHPALERVCEVARSHGCSSKLTGAGGGGCALTVLSGEGLREASLVKDMAAEGFKCYETALGGDGVLWHGHTVPPALAATARTVDAEPGRFGFAKSFLGQHRKEVGIAAATAAAAAVAVASLAPVVFGGRGHGGSRS